MSGCEEILPVCHLFRYVLCNNIFCSINSFTGTSWFMRWFLSCFLKCQTHHPSESPLGICLLLLQTELQQLNLTFNTHLLPEACIQYFFFFSFSFFLFFFFLFSSLLLADPVFDLQSRNSQTWSGQKPELLIQHGGQLPGCWGRGNDMITLPPVSKELCWLLGCSFARSPCCSRAKSCWVLSSLAFQHPGCLRQSLPRARQTIHNACRKYDAIC